MYEMIICCKTFQDVLMPPPKRAKVLVQKKLFAKDVSIY